MLPTSIYRQFSNPFTKGTMHSLPSQLLLSTPSAPSPSNSITIVIIFLHIYLQYCPPVLTPNFQTYLQRNNAFIAITTNSTITIKFHCQHCNRHHLENLSVSLPWSILRNAQWFLLHQIPPPLPFPPSFRASQYDAVALVKK